MDYHVVFVVVKFIDFYHVDSHVATRSVEIHMVNHKVRDWCTVPTIYVEQKWLGAECT